MNCGLNKFNFVFVRACVRARARVLHVSQNGGNLAMAHWQAELTTPRGEGGLRVPGVPRQTAPPPRAWLLPGPFGLLALECLHPPQAGLAMPPPPPMGSDLGVLEDLPAALAGTPRHFLRGWPKYVPSESRSLKSPAAKRIELFLGSICI